MDINEQADPAGIGVPSSEAFGSPALSVEKDAGDDARMTFEPASPPDNTEDFAKALEQTINRFSKENGSNTPDFILSNYLIGCLNSFDGAVNWREKWSGRGGVPGAPDFLSSTTAPAPDQPDAVDNYHELITSTSGFRRSQLGRRSAKMSADNLTRRPQTGQQPDATTQPNAGEAAYLAEQAEPPSDSAGDGPAIHLPEEPARKPSFIDQVREILGTPSSSDHEALTVMIGVAIESLRQCERPYSNLPDAARQEILDRTVRKLFEDLTRETPSPEPISSVEKRNICRAQGFLPITGTPIPDWNIPKADAPKTAQKTDIAPKKVYDYDLDFKGTLLEHMERSNCPGFQSAAARLLIGDERLAELQAGNRRAVQDLARELTEKRDALRSRLPRVSEGVSPPGESAADVVQRLQGEDAKSTYKD